MKNSIKFFSMVILLLLAVSCAKTEDEVDDNSNGTPGSISFTFDGLRHMPQSYVAITPGMNEDAVDFSKSNIYMFNATSGLLEEIFPMNGSNITSTQVGTGYTVTVAGISAYSNDDKIFYFVVNNDNATSITAVKNTTSELEFVNSLTDKLTVTGTKMANLEPPFLFTGNSDAISTIDPISTTVTMKRRVARFDIVNPFTDFVIEKLYITDAKQQGFVFSNPNATPSIDAFSTNEFNFTGTALSYESINNERISRSVFYLYPTTMKESKIVIEATYAGTTKLYYIDSDMEILANSRYKLVVNDNKTFSLLFTEWDEDTMVDFIPGDGRNFSIRNITTSGTGHITQNSAQLVHGGENAYIKVVLSTLSADGAEIASITTTNGAETIVDETLITSTTPVLTYAGAGYEQEFTIPTDYITQVAGHEIILTFKDKANEKAIDYVLLYDGQLIQPIQPESNSYMVAPGGAEVTIPLTRVYDYWTTLPTDETFNAEFLWTDASAGMRPNGAVENVFVKGKGSDAVLRIKTGSIAGNAVIAIKDENNEIKWSYHIWVTDYDPNASITKVDGQYVYAVTGGEVHRYKDSPGASAYWVDGGIYENKFIMDRGIGAYSNNEISGTLYYQWGRKDPFSGTTSSYTQNGLLISNNKSSEQSTIQQAIMNPSTFFLNGVSNDNAAYWNDPNASETAKSIFDPCPVGWKVPHINTWHNISQNSNSQITKAEKTWIYSISASTKINFLWSGYISKISYPLKSDDGCNFWTEKRVNNTAAYCAVMNGSGLILPTNTNLISLGAVVRCIEE